MSTEIKTNITAKDMYGFLINNTYRKLTGVIWIIFSLVVIVITILTWGKVEIMNSILMIVLASLYTVINPVMLYFKASRQVKNNASFKDTLVYRIDEQQISVTQGEEHAEVKWDEVWKVVKYGQSVIIYVSTVRAFILPMRCMDNEYDTLVDICFAKLGGRCHIKKKAA